MIIRLGYVAITQALDITSSKTITYSNYQKKENKEQILDYITKSNLESLYAILTYNIKNEIFFYRITSNLIPLATMPNIKHNWELYKPDFLKVGKLIQDNDLRVSMHPDQFCVLNSINDAVIASSIRILKYHEFMFQAMKCDGDLVLHIGSSVGGKEESIKRFIETFNQLDDYLKEHIIIENDDKVFNVEDVLYLCETLKIPMVLDYHHHMCNCCGNIENYMKRIFATWTNNRRPKIHFSSPKNKKEMRAHHEYIDLEVFLNFVEMTKKYDISYDIMIEAKAKDDALFRLIRGIKYKKDYQFIKNTIFCV